MCSPFCAVVFVVRNDARSICAGAQLKKGFGVWQKMLRSACYTAFVFQHHSLLSNQS